MTTFRELKPLGRPAFEVTEEILEQAFKFRSEGFTVEQTAHNMGTCKATLCKYQAINTDLADALKMGKTFGIQPAINQLRKKVEEGDIAAIIYNLKCFGGDEFRPDKPVSNIEIHNNSDISDVELATKIEKALNGRIEKENKEEDS